MALGTADKAKQQVALWTQASVLLLHIVICKTVRVAVFYINNSKWRIYMSFMR